MNKEIHIVEETRIAELNDFIHDLHFDIEKLFVSSHEIYLPLYNDHRELVGDLIFKGITKLSVDDTEKIGRYDIFELAHKGPNQIQLISNIPLDVRIEYSEFNVSFKYDEEIYKKSYPIPIISWVLDRLKITKK